MSRRFGGLLAVATLLAVVGCARPGGQASGPTPVPEPPSIQLLPGRGIAVQGHGPAQTEDITPDSGLGGLTIGIDLVTLTHDGRSSFIVTAVEGDQSELLTSAIGAYTGQRPLVVEGPLSFQVTADGAWTIKVQPMARGGKPAFSGAGDSVSPYFTPPDPAATWNVSHDGQTGFFVFAHCVGGSVVVEDRTGAFEDTPQIQFPRGPCFWEVRADGAFTLTPRGP